MSVLFLRDPLLVEDLEVPPLLDGDHVDILLRDEVVMEDDFLRLM